MSNSSDDVTIMPEDYTYSDTDSLSPSKPLHGQECVLPVSTNCKSQPAVDSGRKQNGLVDLQKNCMGDTCCRNKKIYAPESKSGKPKNGFMEPKCSFIADKSNSTEHANNFSKPNYGFMETRNGLVASKSLKLCTKGQKNSLLGLGGNMGRSCMVKLPRCEQDIDLPPSPEEASEEKADIQSASEVIKLPESPSSDQCSEERAVVRGPTFQHPSSPSVDISGNTALESFDKVASWTVQSQQQLDSSPAAPPSVVCNWEGCSSVLECDSQLMEHMHKIHVESQNEKETFVCQWLGCKVFNQPSCSRSWLGLHVRSHLGSKPFKCIVAGCGQRFTSEVALERHVNRHFLPPPTASPKTPKSREDTPSKLIKKKKMQKIKRRNRQCK